MKSVNTMHLVSETIYFSIYYAITWYCLFIQLSYFSLGNCLDIEKRSFTYFSLESFPNVNNSPKLK